jgi:hypothetical protein
MKGIRLSFLCLTFLLFLLNTSFATVSSLEERLRIDIEDFRLNDVSYIEAAFILSGISHTDSLENYLHWYSELLTTLENFNFDPFDRIGSANKVFMYLHASWLKEYKRESTTLIDIAKYKQFNCVSGTILYNRLCEDLGWPTEAFETPTHTYTIFPNFTQRVMVENTNSMGFNIMKNLREYSRYLAQFYPKNQVLKIGLDRLYAYENSKGRVINNTELLGLLAYNRAYFYRKNGNFDRAYDFVLLAQSFNNDSRSNVNFEINLYYEWGKQLFNEKRYIKAFEVYADGFYRYPEVKDFSRNTLAAFFNAIQELRKKIDWNSSKDLLEEMFALQILKETHSGQIKSLLWNWMDYFNRNKQQDKVKEVTYYLKKLSLDNSQ